MTKRYHVERVINAPADRVWDLLTDGSNYTSWNPAVISLDGSIRLGETISLVSIVNPKRAFKPKVVEMTAPNRMVWADGMPLGLFKGRRTYLVDEGDGSMTFSLTEQFSGPLAGLITKTIPDMTDSFNQFADGLKNAAEA